MLKEILKNLLPVTQEDDNQDHYEEDDSEDLFGSSDPEDDDPYDEDEEYLNERRVDSDIDED